MYTVSNLLILLCLFILLFCYHVERQIMVII